MTLSLSLISQGALKVFLPLFVPALSWNTLYLSFEFNCYSALLRYFFLKAQLHYVLGRALLTVMFKIHLKEIWWESPRPFLPCTLCPIVPEQSWFMPVVQCIYE